MTSKEFADKMKEIFPGKYEYDVEKSHGKADDLMCELLKQLGYEDGIKIFKDADKWYS